MVTCPVCKVELSDDGDRVLTLGGEKKIEPIKLIHDGKTYFFDSEDCAREFAANPEKYAVK